VQDRVLYGDLAARLLLRLAEQRPGGPPPLLRLAGHRVSGQHESQNARRM
jgi:hypothetical protein